MNVDLKKNIKFVDDRKGKDKIYDLSSLKLKRQLLWKPKIKLSEGLNETISWIDKNIKLFNKESLNYKHKK